MDRSARWVSSQGYQPPASAHDEMVSPTGEVRPQWRAFLASLDAMGQVELNRRWEDARELIRENGVTYNVYGDPRGLDRPWALDPLPLVISPEEGAIVETGLVQRARLMEMILADLYGPQRLLREGLLPPALVFSHPDFLRPCHGCQLPGSRYLHFYAANLGRAPDGRFAVLSDRTQAPSGAGYALENRLVLSRMLPDVFRDCRVQRLAVFFRTLRATLSEMAPHNRENPRIVLLTPGPYNETYFEHAYLARYLGFTLVEGRDLTVRDNHVYLKLLGGLQRVDVVLRRQDDDFCDPLELRRDSFLGVPGLVQAVRTGNVAVANPLGSGLIESPALMGFLPGLCRRLLGEDLELPSTISWWCGESLARDHVLANLSRMVIKPTFATPSREPFFGENLSREELQSLADKIRARPYDFVGQDQITLGTTPVLVGDGMQARHFVLRVFLTATQKQSFAMMPGGLTRFAASPDSIMVSMQKGGGSKDTWLLSSGPVSSFTLLPSARRSVPLSRGGGDLPSRIADDLYWLGRQVERAESAVRLMRTILVRLTEQSGLVDAPDLPTLLKALTHQGYTYPGFVGAGSAARLAAPEKELRSVLFDASRPGSLQWIFEALHRVARRVRDQISADTWRILNGLLQKPFDVPDKEAVNGETVHPSPPGIAPAGTLSDVLDWLGQVVISLTAFGGLAMESMTRGQGWRFLDMGRRLERATHLISLVRNTLVTVSPMEGPLLQAVLDTAESSMTYRRRYLGSLEPAPVLDLLLADETNPRSLAFQLAALVDHVDHLPHDPDQARLRPEQRIMYSALTELRLADIEALSEGAGEGSRKDLLNLLTRLGEQLPMLSDTITQSYLTHVQASRQLAIQVDRCRPLPTE